MTRVPPCLPCPGCGILSGNQIPQEDRKIVQNSSELYPGMGVRSLTVWSHMNKMNHHLLILIIQLIHIKEYNIYFTRGWGGRNGFSHLIGIIAHKPYHYQVWVSDQLIQDLVFSVKHQLCHGL